MTRGDQDAKKVVSDSPELACVAVAKRGGGGGREKGKREGSACSKSLCFCSLRSMAVLVGRAKSNFAATPLLRPARQNRHATQANVFA